MNIKTQHRRFTAFFLVFCMILSSYGLAYAEWDDTDDGSYPSGRLTFSGFTMQQGANGDVQALLKLTLENVEATGVSFNLGYDSDLLVPSDYTTNNDATQALDAFKCNTTDLPEGMNEWTLYTQPNNDSLLFSLFPDPTASDADDGPYVKEDSSNVYGQKIKYFDALNSGKTSLDLGYISFRVKDPAKLAEQSPSSFTALYIDDSDTISPEHDIRIVYIGSDGQEKFIRNLKTTWNVDPKLISVSPKYKKITVPSYTVWYEGGQTGTQQDLINYLNKYYREVILRYSDNSYAKDNIIWDDVGTSFTMTPTAYDPRGGTYKIKQKYNSDIWVDEMTVEVTPVYLLRFTPNRPNINYTAADQPLSWADLAMPDIGTPVISDYFDTFIPSAETLALTDTNWVSTIGGDPDGLTTLNGWTWSSAVPYQKVDYQYTISPAEFAAYEAAHPWLTTAGANDLMKAKRGIGDLTDDPNMVTATVHREDGYMTITVPQLGGSPVPDGTSFRIYMPNGLIIDTEDLGDITSVNIPTGGGTATITIDTSQPSTVFTAAELDSIQKYFNLGNKDYYLTATEHSPDKGESGMVKFNAKRENYYMVSKSDPYVTGTNVIDVDYSGGLSSLFPVYTDQLLTSLSTYFDFPDSTVIPTGYNGKTGSSTVDAALKSAKVISWSILEYPGATQFSSTAGEVVTLVGVLENYYYTNYGQVNNPYNVELHIKVKLKDSGGTPPDPANENIEVYTKPGSTELLVPNNGLYNFDTKQEGYTVPQTSVFTIKNLGLTDVNGLTVTIDNTDFILDSPPNPTSIVTSGTAGVVGGTSDFAIRTTVGLPVGVYSAWVTISSSLNTSLYKFKIQYTVVADPVYKVKVVADPSSNAWGTAWIIDSTVGVIPSQTFVDGDTVQIAAQAVDADYEFDYWSSDPAGYAPTIVDTTAPGPAPLLIKGNFNVDVGGIGINGANEIVITAHFKETIQAQLRLDGLEDREENNTTVNPLRNVSTNAIMAFNPAVKDYNVYVPYESEKNIAWFKPKYMDIGGTSITVTAEINGNPVAVSLDGTTAYITAKFPLPNVEPTPNILKITQSFGSDSRTYTINIYRKKPVNVKKMYGNSPYGLIEQDTANSAITTWKADAKAQFDAERTYGAYYPDKAADTTVTYYSEDAWGNGTNTDYDRHDYALFVYKGTTFADPGFKDLYDSAGTPVAPASVTRTIDVDILTNPTDPDIETMLSTVTTTTITISDTGETADITELATLDIRPGIYTLVYTFTDSDGSAATFSRPVIILSEKGDLNLDLSVNASNFYKEINERFNNDFLKDVIRGNAGWTDLYTYRIADVNEDRNANTIDGKAVTEGLPITSRQYYVPLPTNKTLIPTWSPGVFPTTTPTPYPVPTQKAEMDLEYMGITSTGGAAPNTKPATAVKIESADVGKILWVGVSVEHAERIGDYFTTDGISTIDMAVDYDPLLLEPCDDSGSTVKNDVYNEIYFDNLMSGAGSLDTLFWDDNAVELDEDASTLDYGSPPDNDAWRYSPADLDYKTAVIALRPKSGGTTDYKFKGLTTGTAQPKTYLLRMAFKIKAAPTSSKEPVQMHLGPQTFIMGAGTGGAENYGAWEETDKTIPTINLKNYFKFLTSYTTSDKYLTNLQAYTYGPDDPGPPVVPFVPTEITLYQDPDQTTSGFVQNVFDYYGSIPNDIEQVKLVLTPDKVVTVDYKEVTAVYPTASPPNEVQTASSPASVATTQTTHPYATPVPVTVTDPVSMVTVDPDLLTDTDSDGKGDKYGYTNLITIHMPDGVTTYTVHIRRYLKPEIRLNYGNSPAGMIYNDTEHGWSESDKDTALTKFIGKSTNKLKKFDSAYVPVISGSILAGTAVYAQTERPYTVNAWNNYKDASNKVINYDLDKYALFVYNGKNFKDPGGVVINELGLEVPSATLASTVTFKEQTKDGVPVYGTTTGYKDYTPTLTGGKFKMTMKRIRPDVYFMDYTCAYVDMFGNTQNLTAQRPTIVISRLGDLFLSTIVSVNASDSKYLYNNVTAVNKGHSLVAFRMGDVVKDTLIPTVNVSDSKNLYNNVTTVNKSPFRFYPEP